MGDKGEVVLWQTVDSDERRMRLIESLVQENLPLTLENGAEYLPVTVRQMEGAGLQVEMERAGPLPFRPNETLTARFKSGGEMYVFRCLPSFHGTRALLPFPTELFKLQRRKDFRMAVPEGFPARFEITERATGRVPLKVNLVNIHTNGVGLEAPPTEKFTVGEAVRGELILGARKPVKVAAHVRFLKSDSDRVQIGAEFDHGMLGTMDLLYEAIALFRFDVFHFNS